MWFIELQPRWNFFRMRTTSVTFSHCYWHHIALKISFCCRLEMFVMNSIKDRGQNNTYMQNLNSSQAIYTTAKFLNHKYIFPMLSTIKMRVRTQPHIHWQQVYFLSLNYSFCNIFRTSMQCKKDICISKSN